MAQFPNGPQLERNGDSRRSIGIPSTRWWRRLLAFVGPAYMVSVGYMDPGNWATELAGGSQFGYTLLWVLVLSNLMAILLQTLSARLGLVTGHDLAQACRDEYPPAVRYVLFALTEIAIIATDLAEVLGSAVGLNLLFHIPVEWAVVVTAADVLLLLVIQRLGIRKMEAFIVMLVATIGTCFIIEIFLSRPDWGLAARGLVPGGMNLTQLYVAIGILGATVMPHNLYLHSSLVQSRNVPRSREGVLQACRFNLIDSVVALNGALLVNAAILITAAAAFWPGNPVDQLQDAHALLEGLLGSWIAPTAFAVALLASGQSSTVTGTLAGQITMEGFLNFRIRPWLQRLVTRLLAIAPAVVIIFLAKYAGSEAGSGGTPSAEASGNEAVFKLLIFSQVLLSLQLPFAVIPLVKFTSSARKMGPFVNPRWASLLAWLAAAIIVALNVWLVGGQILDWARGVGEYGWILTGATLPVAAGLAGLLLWMTLRRETPHEMHPPPAVDEMVAAARETPRQFHRIGVALEAGPQDVPMLAQAIDTASAHHAELVLMHVVGSVGGQWYGAQTGDMESRQDEQYLADLAERLRQELRDQPVSAIHWAIGYGDVPREIVRIVKAESIDLLVMGGHGHKTLGDMIHGETIQQVRHGVNIPVLAVRRPKDQG